MVFVFVLFTALSFGQIYRCEGEGKSGPVTVSLHFVEYADYRYLLLIDGVSVFLDEENITRLQAVLEKFSTWESIAAEGQVTLTKTIDSITFASFHYSHTFFKEPVVFYFVFTGSTETAELDNPTRYFLFVDTTLDRILPFRLSSQTAAEFLEALSPEKLAASWESYRQQKALEALFN